MEMIEQMFNQSARWQDTSYCIPDALVFMRVPRSVAFLGCCGAGITLSLYCLRLEPDETTYKLAVCGALARLLTYHQGYDNVLVILLASRWDACSWSKLTC